MGQSRTACKRESNGNSTIYFNVTLSA